MNVRYFIILSLLFFKAQGMDKIGYWKLYNEKKQPVSDVIKLLFNQKKNIQEKIVDKNIPIKYDPVASSTCYSEDDFSGNNNDDDIYYDGELTQQQKAFASIKNKTGNFYKYNGSKNENENNKINVQFFYQGCKNRPYNNPDWLKNIDIEQLQEDATNNDAVFQVASRFHCNEGGNYRLPVSTYFGPNPQGQTAARSALAGTLIRKYGTQLNNLDLLEKFHKKYKPTDIYQSGHYNIQYGQLSNLKKDFNFNTNSQKIAPLIDVGVQENTYSTNNNNKIHQIFTSTVCGPHNQNEILVTQACLKSAYDNTIKWAWEKDKTTIYLTLIGGGVFSNPPKLIFEAIQNACTKLSSTHKRTTPLNVILIGYANQNYLQEYEKLAQKTNGTFTIYDRV